MNSVFRFIILSFTFLYTTISFAQGKQGLYTYFNTGYKLGSSMTSFPDERIVDGHNVSVANLRMGGGNSFTGGLGWMIHPNIGLESSMTYTAGEKKRLSNSYANYTQYEKTVQSQNLHVVGSIVVQTVISKWTLYAKAGVVLGLMNQTMMRTSWTENNDFFNYSYLHKGEIMRGFNGSMGFIYPLTKNMNIMFEAEEVSIQGHYQVAQLAENRSMLHLPFELTYVDNTTSVGSTSQELYVKKNPVAFSCIGVNVGLLFHF